MTKKVSKVKEGVVKAYVSIENAVVGSYKAIENAAVGGYKAIENKAVEFGHSLVEEYDRQKRDDNKKQSK